VIAQIKFTFLAAKVKFELNLRFLWQLKFGLNLALAQGLIFKFERKTRVTRKI